MKYNARIVKSVIENSDILVVAMSDSKKMRKIKVRENQRFLTNCFYHNDKHPSFSFKRDKRANEFYCFSCKASGNVINLLMHMYNLKFLESVETLAAAFDVQLPERSYNEANAEIVSRLREVRESLEYKEILTESYRRKSLKK